MRQMGIEELEGVEVPFVQEVEVDQAEVEVDQAEVEAVERRRRKTDLERGIDALTQDALKRVRNVGGYPDGIYCFPPGWVILASAAEGEVQLSFWREETVAAWYREARQMMKTYRSLDIGSAMWETIPDEDKR